MGDSLGYRDDTVFYFCEELSALRRKERGHPVTKHNKLSHLYE
jgi:hypothetical protein